ncbi:MAG: hypothetical protein A2297_02120 [Elusimicrobia bacterium RIFOXYB2_FULL_48_7]|nr:MAG: hypothetical protein A2297_02120 [Elusimicrobia bacterium RIFOXYB2_FULL_48_7]
MVENSIFVLGDSISIHYGPYLKKLIAKNFTYSRKGGRKALSDKYLNDYSVNGGDSKSVVEYLRKNRQDYRKSGYLLLNCGLHDIKTNPETGKKQVQHAAFKRNIEQCVNLLDKLELTIIWARITPVKDKWHNRITKNFSRYNRDVDAYNKIADGIMKKHGIHTLDLYSLTAKMKGNPYCDHIHFKKGPRILQAKFIAKYLNNL